MKLMTLGFDCSIPYILGKAKTSKLPQVYENYEIGLFDWCLPDVSSPRILVDRLVSYNLDHSLFSIQQSYSSKNELTLSTAGIDYIHVKKLATIEKSVESYIQRLKYLEDKTIKHYENNGWFIVNLSTKLQYGNSDLYSLSELYRSNGSYLDKFNIIALVDNDYKIPKRFEKATNFVFLKLDKDINFETATKQAKIDYQEYFINRLKEFEWLN